jgi:hypothetical protein
MSSIFLRISLAAVLLAALAPAESDSRVRFVRTRLAGFQEVPAVSTEARGLFEARINTAGTELTYKLEYSDLQAPVTQAHIHFGAKSTNGGVMIWLCGTATNPGPAGTPACPASGEVSRTVTAADVVGPAGQGISAGEFAEALRSIRSGVAYANVHSTMFPGGEIRGQLRDDESDEN